jgi:hypothetical protein
MLSVIRRVVMLSFAKLSVLMLVDVILNAIKLIVVMLGKNLKVRILPKVKIIFAIVPPKILRRS